MIRRTQGRTKKNTNRNCEKNRKPKSSSLKSPKSSSLTVLTTASAERTPLRPTLTVVKPLPLKVRSDSKLYYGDNLDVLRRHVDDESIDLVYLGVTARSLFSLRPLRSAHTSCRCAAVAYCLETKRVASDAP
jgi:hypothetical protein